VLRHAYMVVFPNDLESLCMSIVKYGAVCFLLRRMRMLVFPKGLES
jgi:hypothetical protein